MTDKQQSISDNKVNSEDTKVVDKPAEVVQEQTQKPVDNKVFDSKPQPEKQEEKRVPLHELYKERNKRRALEDEIVRIRQEQEDLRQRFDKVQGSSDDEELVSEAEKELGIDRESAKKLLRLQKKVVEKSSTKSNQQPNQPTINDPVLSAMNDFKRRASESSMDYEDWDSMIPSMQAIMSREIEQNGISAYYKSPDYYYSKALKARQLSESSVKKEVEIDKINNTSASTVETGSKQIGQTSSSKLTQAVFDANRNNPKWVKENIGEIKELWRKGKLK